MNNPQQKPYSEFSILEWFCVGMVAFYLFLNTVCFFAYRRVLTPMFDSLKENVPVHIQLPFTMWFWPSVAVIFAVLLALALLLRQISLRRRRVLIIFSVLGVLGLKAMFFDGAIWSLSKANDMTVKCLKQNMELMNNRQK